MKLGLRTRMLVASAVLAVVVALSLGALLLQLGAQRSSARDARHSQEVLAASNRLEKLVLDLETGERGFLLTGQSSFLAPYRTAREGYPLQARRLTRLVADDEQQEDLALAISDDVDSYAREYLAPLLTLAQQERRAAAARVARGEGKRRVDRIRRLFTRLQANEQALASSRDRRTSQDASRTLTVGLVGLSASVLLVLLFGLYLTRLIVEPLRRLTGAASRLAAGDLSARVPAAGHGEVAELARTFNTMADSVQTAHRQLDRFFTTTLDLLGIIGQDGRLVRASPAFRSTLGYDETELLTVPLIDLIHADDREQARAQGALLAEGGIAGYSARTRTKTGEYRTLLWSAVPDDDLGLVYVAARDITERELAAEELRASEARLAASNVELESQNAELELQTIELEEQQAQLEVSRDELAAQQGELEHTLAELAEEKERVETSATFAVRIAAETDVSLLAEVALGSIADAISADAGTIYVSTEAGEGAFALAASRGLDPKALAVEVSPGAGLVGRALVERRAVTADHGETGLRIPAFGSELQVGHELHVPLQAGGRLVGALTLARIGSRPFTRDVVELVEHLGNQSAVALSHAVALRSSRELAAVNSAVLDSTADAIRMVDLDGRTVLMNRAMAAMSSSALRFVEGQSIWEMTAGLAQRTREPAAYLEAMAALRNDPELEATDSYELVDTGTSVQRYSGPVRGPDGAIMGRIFVLRDTTADRELERLKDDLLATVSHELRTPLASILGFTELLATRELDKDNRERYTTTIHKEAMRLTDLITDFLDLQRIAEGGLTIHREAFDLTDLLRRQVELYSVQSETHAIELLLPDQPLTALGDQERIGQVVGNLLSNAIKYSPGAERVTLAASAQGGESVRIEVCDEGIGIPADQQSQLFTKFFRVDSSDTRRIGGTGLGLAIVREIVEAHGGRVGVESARGKGSTFWIELPAPVAAREPSSRRLALVIEDDAAAASLLCELLDAEGLDAAIASSGASGLEEAQRRPPDLVCLDIELGGKLDGWQVLERLKASPLTAAVPVVICTAGNGRGRATALGASDFIVKPFSGKQLGDAVARLLPEGRSSILVVDDDDGVRSAIVERLGADGHELREARDGIEALAAVAERLPDAIVLDLSMPRLDGFGVLEALRADPGTRPIPVVVLTARRLSGPQRRQLLERAVSVLDKPEGVGEMLRETLARALAV